MVIGPATAGAVGTSIEAALTAASSIHVVSPGDLSSLPTAPELPPNSVIIVGTVFGLFNPFKVLQ